MKSQTPFVSIARDDDHASAVYQALDRLSLPDLNGKRILLKPNVGREVDPRTGVNTNPAVVEAVFQYLSGRYPAEFFIGDSPIISTDTKAAFQQSGYAGLLADPGITFVDLDAAPPITLPIPDGAVIQELRVIGLLQTIDYIVSIPVLKMHMHTGASLGIKNLKGLIYKRDKISLHHLENPGAVDAARLLCPDVKELDIAIADLARVLIPNLTVIDGTYAQEGMGPSSGTVRKLDMVLASTDPMAADVAALALTRPDWNLERVPHLRLIAAARRPQGPCSINDIICSPLSWENFISRLEPPPQSVSFAYKNVTVTDIDSCSACLSTVFVFLKNNRDFIDAHFTEQDPLNLVIGKGVGSVDLYEPSFLIGNCTRERKNEGHFIRGCCPVQSKIRSTIEDYLRESGRLNRSTG